MRGPADPDQFRMQVGRYGDRFYIDNLPPCDLHDPGDIAQPHPSVSTIKGAWPKFLTAWAGKEAAQYAVDNLETLRKLDPESAVEVISKASDRSKNRAARRGTDIHLIVEQLADGKRPDYTQITDDVAPYVGCVEQMVRDLQLDPIATECVVFNHDVGYGGTFDMIAGSVHGVCLFDWKTRKRNDAYPEEACQGAAYLGGNYMIVENERGYPVRVEIPEVDRLCIVTITPDAYKVHEINEQDAWAAWKALARFWYAKKNAKFYDGILPTPRRDHLIVDEDDLRKRINAFSPKAKQYLARCWPTDLPTLKQNPELTDLFRIDHLVKEVEALAGAQFAFPDLPDEGRTIDLFDVKHLEAIAGEVPLPWRKEIHDIIEGSVPPVRMGTHGRTQRKFDILRMLVYAAGLAEEASNRFAHEFRVAQFVPINELGYASIEEVNNVIDEIHRLLNDDDLLTSRISEIQESENSDE